MIATATNPRQMDALLNTLDESLREKDVRARRREGTPDSGWVLLDFSDVIVHLFAPEERGYYSLESLWSAGVPLLRVQ